MQAMGFPSYFLLSAAHHFSSAVTYGWYSKVPGRRGRFGESIRIYLGSQYKPCEVARVLTLGTGGTDR
jgi:hypothetical protein